MPNRDWLLPWILVGLLLAVYSLVAVVLLVEPVRFGTVVEWFGAIGTILVGGLAAWFAYSASQWAGVAARAEQRNAMLTERELASRVQFEVTAQSVGPREHGVAIINLDTTPQSPVVWVTNVAPDVSVFRNEEADRMEEAGSRLRRAFEKSLREPSQIVPGEGHGVLWVHGFGDSEDLEGFKSGVLVGLAIHYQVSDDDAAETFTHHRIKLSLRELTASR